MDEFSAIEGKIASVRRRARAFQISEEQIQTFLEVLADSCNVSRAAKAAGMDLSWAYRRRKIDAGFRRSWREAVAEGYAKLELVLLERAMIGTPRKVRDADGKSRTIRQYSDSLAIALLKRHAALADEADSEMEITEEVLAETRERILAKLEMADERRRRAAAGDAK